MTIDLGERVKAVNDHISTRLGKTITYKRWQGETYNPDTGGTITYWEQPSFTATVMGVSETDVDSSSGNVKIGDSKFSFKSSEFTDHTNYEYLSFTSGSTEFTVGETLTGATGGATGVVVNYYLLNTGGGSWAAGDAAGVVWLSSVTGTFQSEDLNGSTAGANCATASGASVSGGTDFVLPGPKDTITYNGKTWVMDLGSDTMVYRLDVTGELLQVYGRRGS